MSEQANFDDVLGAAVLPTLTVWRTLGTVCGWCLRDCGGQLMGTGSYDSDHTGTIYTSCCASCREMHGINGQIHAIRDGRVIIIENGERQ